MCLSRPSCICFQANPTSTLPLSNMLFLAKCLFWTAVHCCSQTLHGFHCHTKYKLFSAAHKYSSPLASPLATSHCILTAKHIMLFHVFKLLSCYTLCLQKGTPSSLPSKPENLSALSRICSTLTSSSLLP
jgi:hypothetical protein